MLLLHCYGIFVVLLLRCSCTTIVLTLYCCCTATVLLLYCIATRAEGVGAGCVGVRVCCGCGYKLTASSTLKKSHADSSGTGLRELAWARVGVLLRQEAACLRQSVSPGRLPGAL